MKRSTVRSLTLVVLERLTDDPPGQCGRHRADLGAQLRSAPAGARPRAAACAAARMRSASACACSRISAMIAAPCSRASSRMRGRLVPGLDQLLPVLALGCLGLRLRLLELLELVAGSRPGAPVIALLIGGMTHLPSMYTMSAKASSSTKNVALGTRKLLSARLYALRVSSHRWSPVSFSAVEVEAAQASTKTNSAMKARLMKYIASTRPTVRKKIVNRRPCASG